mgnify:CR=1 FL=1
MKKKYIWSILAVLILIGWFGIAEYQDIKNREDLYKMELEYYNTQCNKSMEKCEELIKPTHYKMDALGQALYTIKTSNFNYMILFFIGVPGMYQFYKEFRSGYIKNILIRESYSKYMKKVVFDSLKKTIFITPLTLLGCFIISYILCDGIVDINYTFNHSMQGISMPSDTYLKSLPLFLTTYVLNLILLTIICVNISLICVKKAKNFILAIIMSLLVYFLTNIVLNVGLGTIIFEMLFHIDGAAYYTSFYNLISYEAPINNATIYGLIYMIIFMVISTIISYICLYWYYRNKEKVLIEVEKG